MNLSRSKLSMLLVGVLVISCVSCGIADGKLGNLENGNIEDFENIESFENRINSLKNDIEAFYTSPQFKRSKTDPIRILTKNTEKIAKITNIISYLQSEAGRLLTYLETKANLTQDYKNQTDEFIDFIATQITDLKKLMVSVENDHQTTPATQ